jgi:hypothetical protein
MTARITNGVINPGGMAFCGLKSGAAQAASGCISMMGRVVAGDRGDQQRSAMDSEQHCDSRKGPMPFQDWWQRSHAPLWLRKRFGDIA